MPRRGRRPPWLAHETLAVLLLLAVPLAGCVSPGDPATAASRDPAGPPTGFTDTHVFPGDYAVEGPYSRVLEEGSHEAGPLEFVELTSSRDGAPIEMGIVRPRDPVPEGAPVILDASLYLRGLEDPREDRSRREAYRDYAFTRFLVDNFVPHGYTVALLAARGTAGSGGCNDALGPANREALDQAIGWLAQRDWTNGRVGMFGFSSDGVLAWNGAATGHPALETVVPVDAWPDRFTRFQRNGTWSSTGVTNPAAKAAGGAFYTPLPPSPGAVPAYLDRFACPRQEASAVQAGAWKAATGTDDDPAGHWDAHDVRDEVLDRYQGSAFVVHGLQDGAVPPHNAHAFASRLEEAGVPVKQLYGQWAHEPPDGAGDRPFPTSVRWDFAEVLLRWFDHWLEPGTRRDLGPRVQVQDTSGSWHSHQEWPPASAGRTPLYLHPDGSLAGDPPSETGEVVLGPAPDQLLLPPSGSGPDASLPCPGCAVFRTGPLEDPLRFGGPPEIDLAATPTAPTGSVAAHLYLVDGEARYLTGGQLDLRHADGDPAEPLVPGRSVEAHPVLEPVDAVVPPGASLALVLSQGSWHHVDDGNGPAGTAPLGYGAGGVPEPGPVRVELGDGRSRLTMGAFELPEGATFAPPGTSPPSGP